MFSINGAALYAALVILINCDVNHVASPSTNNRMAIAVVTCSCVIGFGVGVLLARLSIDCFSVRDELEVGSKMRTLCPESTSHAVRGQIINLDSSDCEHKVRCSPKAVESSCPIFDNVVSGDKELCSDHLSSSPEPRDSVDPCSEGDPDCSKVAFSDNAVIPADHIRSSTGFDESFGLSLQLQISDDWEAQGRSIYYLVLNEWRESLSRLCGQRSLMTRVLHPLAWRPSDRRYDNCRNRTARKSSRGACTQDWVVRIPIGLPSRHPQ